MMDEMGHLAMLLLHNATKTYWPAAMIFSQSKNLSLAEEVIIVF
jgi:hypothetical protein